jgi:hypothetical protein
MDQVVVDYVSIEAADHAIEIGVGADPQHPSTPPPKSLKLMIVMVFITLTDVEKFYKSYAHDDGFSIRVGQHKQNDEILFKRYICSREGYRNESVTDVSVTDVRDESRKKGRHHL